MLLTTHVVLSKQSIVAKYCVLICQSFLEESRQLMRLPPRQSTAEADLMVPFQLVGAFSRPLTSVAYLGKKIYK